MISEALRQTIELRILLYITSRMKRKVFRRKFLKILVSLWGFTFFFCFRKFQKTEQKIISFSSWNFGTILKAVVAVVVIEPTILKSLHALFVLCNDPPSVLLKCFFFCENFAVCVLFYQSLSSHIKTYWKRFLFFYSLRCFALSNKWVKKVVLSSLKSSLRRKQLTR